MLVVTGLTVGGAEVQVRDLAIGLTKRGHDVEVVSLMRPRAFEDALAAHGVPVTSLEISRERKSLVQVLAAAWRFRRHVRRHRPDVVHAHMVHANLFSRLALAFSGNRLISTIHNVYEGGQLRDWGYRLTNWGSNRNTTISEAARRRSVEQRVLPDSTIIVPNGIELANYAPAETPAPDHPFRWIAVGRLEKQKDYPTLLSAMSQLHEATLSIAGDGAQRARLENLARELALSDRAFFLGVRHDVPALLARHDGFVLSSRWEGFGIAVVEAMAAGLPVVVTDSGGPPEIAGRDGAAGLVVEPGNPAAMAAAMRTIMGLSLPERAAMGLAGRRRVQARFDLQSVIDRWEQIYARLAAGKITQIAE